MSYLLADCPRCENERYVEDGQLPCPRCNPALVKLVPDGAQACYFVVAGPVEIEVGGHAFDVRLDSMDASFPLGDVVVIPALEAG